VYLKFVTFETFFHQKTKAFYSALSINEKLESSLYAVVASILFKALN